MKKSSTDKRSGNLEEVFRTGFGEAEVTPSANLWDRIDKQLDTQEQASVYKKRAAFYGRLVLLSALLLLLVGGAWFYQYQKNSAAENKVVADGQNQTTHSQAIARAGLPESEKAATEAPYVGNSSIPGNTASATNPTDYPAKPAETTPSPAQAGSTVTRQLNQQISSSTRNTEPTNTTSETKSSPAKAPVKAVAKAANASVKASISGVTTAKTKRNSGNQNQAGAASALALNSAAQTSGQGQKPTGLQTQNSDAGNGKNNSDNANSATPQNNNQAAAAADKPVQEINAIAVETPAVSKNPTSDSTPVAPAETPLVVIPATTVSDSVAAAFTKPEPGPKGHFSISALYAGYQFEQGLVVSNSVPGAAPPSAAYRKAAQEFNELAKPEPSYRAEVRAAYWVHDRIRLEAGLGYSRNRAATLGSYEIRSFIFNPGSGAMELASQSSIIEPVLTGAHRDSVDAVSVPGFETTYQYDFLSLPLRVTYQSDNHGWHWFASGGVSAARLLNSKITSTRNGLSSEESPKQAFRDWNFAGVFSFGLGYQVNQHISFGVGPDLSYSLNSLMSSDKAGVRQANPYTLGVAGGITYTFR